QCFLAQAGVDPEAEATLGGEAPVRGKSTIERRIRLDLARVMDRHHAARPDSWDEALDCRFNAVARGPRDDRRYETCRRFVQGTGGMAVRGSADDPAGRVRRPCTDARSHQCRVAGPHRVVIVSPEGRLPTGSRALEVGDL